MKSEFRRGERHFPTNSEIFLSWRGQVLDTLGQGCALQIIFFLSNLNLTSGFLKAYAILFHRLIVLIELKPLTADKQMQGCGSSLLDKSLPLPAISNKYLACTLLFFIRKSLDSLTAGFTPLQ